MDSSTTHHFPQTIPHRRDRSGHLGMPILSQAITSHPIPPQLQGMNKLGHHQSKSPELSELIDRCHFGDCLDTLRLMPAGITDTCVTSPPYFGQRDYKDPRQIGLEGTTTAYVAKLVAVFREVRRVLRDDRTLWLNLGDSYGTNTKQLLGIPWRVAFALQDDGWVLRQDIIWHKSNAMPEKVRDRCTNAHEYIFLLSKSKNYYFDHEAMQEPVAESSLVSLARIVDASQATQKESIHHGPTNPT